VNDAGDNDSPENGIEKRFEKISKEKTNQPKKQKKDYMACPRCLH
jgi:hypothetical protein